MNVQVRAAVVSLFASMVLATGCAKETTRPAAVITETTGSRAPAAGASVAARGSVVVSNEIAQACRIDFDSVASAPKFNFDAAALSSEDRDVLRKVATCVTEGPLAGRSIQLVGRADPRGEAEYNMTLGEHRADSAARYLGELGVAKGKVAETSRGKLDASGVDEAGWQLDRRVDVLLH